MIASWLCNLGSGKSILFIIWWIALFLFILLPFCLLLLHYHEISESSFNEMCFFLWEGQYHLLRNFFILSQSLSSFMSISLPEISSSHYIPRTSSIFQKSAISSITDFTSEVIHFSFLAVYTSLWDTKASSLLQLSTFVKVTWVYHLNQGGNKWHTLLCLNWITDE